jgi:hypothetical protein
MKKLFSLFFLSLFIISAHADVLFVEEFNYTSGTALGTVEGWTTAGDMTKGEGRIVNDLSLTYVTTAGEYILSGGKSLKHNYASNKTGDVNGEQYVSYNDFAKVESGAVYLTYMFKADGAQMQSNSELLGLTSGSNNPSARPWIGKLDSDESGNTFRLGLTMYSGKKEEVVWGETAYSIEDVILLVLKYDLGNKAASLFINPTLGTTVEPTADLVDDKGTVRTNINHVMFRNQGGNKALFYVGGVRVSTTWAEAVAIKPQEESIARVNTNFDDGTWGTISEKYTSGSYPSGTINGWQLDKAGMQSGSVTYTATGEQFKNRIVIDKKEKGGMVTLPTLTSAAQIVIYASAGTEDRAMTLQSYNYKTAEWEDVATYTFAEKSTCYRFIANLTGDGLTRLRIANADGSVKNIWKVITYVTEPTYLSAPASLGVANVTAHAFTATWDAVEGSNGYTLMLYGADGERKSTKTVKGGDVTQYVFENLDANTLYSFRVKATGDEETMISSDLSEFKEVTTALEMTNVYTRDVTNGNYGTICLPYGCDDISSVGAIFFSVAGKVMDGSKLKELKEIVLNEVSSLEAGKPYIFYATSDQLTIPLSGEQATEAKRENGLVGCYTVTKVTNSVYCFILKDNKLYCAKEHNYYAGENRAYVRIDEMSAFDGSAAAPGKRQVRMAVEQEQTATGMEDVVMQGSNGKIIRDGQLYIYRDGQMYDVMGRMVK